MNRCSYYIGVVILILLVLIGVGICLDLLFNPWLYVVSEHWHWYNYLTTSHAMTIAVIRHNYALLAVIPIVTVIWLWLKLKE